MLLFSRQEKILYILDTTILILYRKLYINIVSIIVLNIEARKCNIKINLAISCSSTKFDEMEIVRVLRRVWVCQIFLGGRYDNQTLFMYFEARNSNFMISRRKSWQFFYLFNNLV